MRKLIDGTYMMANGKILGKCVYCGKWVQVNKPLFGSIHICLSEEERAWVDYLKYSRQKPTSTHGEK